MTMRISINVATLPGRDSVSRLDQLGSAADDLGVHTLWIPDHLQQVTPGRSEDEPVFEPYQALAWLAARTSRVHLGAMVSSVGFRPIPLLLKQVSGLDVLSGGRAWFGIGAGYPSAENEALAMPLPSQRRRFELVEDAVRLARQVWSGSREVFVGAATVVPRPVLRPLPVQPGGPPILIGGAGEKRTLGLVARFADACNLFDMPDEPLRHKLRVLARHLALAERDPSEVERTISIRWDGSDPGSVHRRLAELHNLGFDHAVVLRRGDWTADALARLMESER